MPIIIDTNCLANVFSAKSSNHDEFKPVLEWIILGKGMMVYGGTKYTEELRKTPKFNAIIRFLKDVGKVHVGDNLKIDNYQKEIESKGISLSFDDPHLPAIVIDTKCKIICSKDSKSIRFVTDPKHYPSGVAKPVYYTSSKNSKLLNDSYVHASLKPLCRINKSSSKLLKRMVDSK